MQCHLHRETSRRIVLLCRISHEPSSRTLSRRLDNTLQQEVYQILIELCLRVLGLIRHILESPKQARCHRECLAKTHFYLVALFPLAELYSYRSDTLLPIPNLSKSRQTLPCSLIVSDRH